MTSSRKDSGKMVSEKEKARASRIMMALRQHHPDAKIALNYADPLQLLVATILSAQCTDVRVNKVTAKIFQKYQRAEDYINVTPQELEEDIKSTGFFRNKAKSIQACCQKLIDEYGGRVPDSMEALVKLPGIGRKTANVILGNAFGIPGIVVDTHVKRLAGRMGLSSKSDPVKIEFDLQLLIPRVEWTNFSHLMIFHGRRICQARKAQCDICLVLPDCPGGQKKEGQVHGEKGQ